MSAPQRNKMYQALDSNSTCKKDEFIVGLGFVDNKKNTEKHQPSFQV